jgi:hypothetical protein
VNDQEAYEYYLDPEHRESAGPGRKHPKDELTKILTARISPSLLGQITAAAASEGRPVSAWVRRALRNELEQSGWRASERRRREAAHATTAEVTGGRAVPPRAFPRPEGIIPGSGRAGEPRALTSSLSMRPQTFTCPHFSIGNVTSASCEQCGPLTAAA